MAEIFFTIESCLVNLINFGAQKQLPHMDNTYMKKNILTVKLNVLRWKL